MALITPIDLSTPNDGLGDPLRDGGDIINSNFTKLNTAKLETGGYGGDALNLADLIAVRTEQGGYTGTGQDLLDLINLRTEKGGYTGTSKDLADLITALENVAGWGFYADGETITPTQTITTTAQLLSIDGAGATSNSAYLPNEIRGVSELWDVATNKIVPINLGDDYTLRVDLEITSKTGSPTEIDFGLDIGGLATPSVVIVQRIIGTGKTPPYTVSVGFPIFCLTTFVTNGGQIFLATDTGTVTIARRQISIHRLGNGSLI